MDRDRCYKDSFFRDLLGNAPDCNSRFIDVVNATFGTSFDIRTNKIVDASLDNVSFTNLRMDVAKERHCEAVDMVNSKVDRRGNLKSAH